MQYRLFGIIPISLGEFDKVGLSQVSVAGRDVLKATLGDQELLVGEKIKPTTISKTWLQRTGEYELLNRGDDVAYIDKLHLSYDDGFLLLQFTKSFFSNVVSRHALTPVSDDEAVIAGLGSGLGDTIKVIMIDGKEGLQYSGYQFKMKAK